MSQAKVDRYKQEKKNRAKNLKKKKAKKVASVVIGACLVGAAIGYPLGRHIYKVSEEKRAAKATIAAENFDNWSKTLWGNEYAGSTGLALDSVSATDTDAEEDEATNTDASTSDAASASDAE